MKKLIAEKAYAHHKNMNRQQAMTCLTEMDLVWCYRPSKLEDNTLELSTKLMEMVGIGASCLCYPNAQNKTALGDDYPFYVRSYEDLESIVFGEVLQVPKATISSVQNQHSFELLAARVRNDIQSPPELPTKSPRIGFALHDPKFILPFVSNLKSKGYSVKQDIWEWGRSQDLDRAQNLLAWADIIFCEWGLANAVYYAEQNTQKKPLYIRIHLQEIKERAQKFGRALNVEHVTKLIFVSEEVRQQALELFGWPAEKTIVIPNFILGDEYLTLGKPRDSEQVNFGMVGIIPQRKRFDRALDLLARARESGLDAHLYIKGPRPEELEFMRAAGRAEELVFYNEQYKRFEGNENLEPYVHFEAWGNDVALWYEKIDFILSPSDFESFHYALADGVLSGCVPLIWDWEEASRIYDKDWIVESVEDALGRVRSTLAQSNADRRTDILSKREYVLSKYGHETVFKMLEECLLGGADWQELQTSDADSHCPVP